MPTRVDSRDRSAYGPPQSERLRDAHVHVHGLDAEAFVALDVMRA